MQSHKSHDFLLGRHLQDPCVGLWKSVFFVRGGVMKKTIRKSTCKAMETLTFHAASICKSMRTAMEICVFFDLELICKTTETKTCYWQAFERSVREAMELFLAEGARSRNFHAASQGKIHAWGYGNLCFFRGGWHGKDMPKIQMLSH